MLFERSGSNWTQLGSTYNSGPLTAGDKLQVQAVGSTISFLAERGAADLGHRHHADRRRAGHHVVRHRPGGQLDRRLRRRRWTTTYTIGGTVSGLTGTVILQNNSGDSLSVAANGSFTFATPLADGATYNVTVRTNPSGQTCTVANGTGTVHAANVTSVSVTCAAAAQHAGLRRLQPGRRTARAELGRRQRRRPGHLRPAGDRHRRERRVR